MKKIAIVSSVEKCNKVEEDIWLKEKLVEMGYDASILPWEDKNIKWNIFSAIIIKSTWKYEKKIPEFIQWLNSVKQYNVINKVDIIFENLYKDNQIRILKKKKIPIIETSIGNKMLDTILKINLFKIKYKDVVIKPSISAGGNNTYVYTKDENLNKNAIRNIKTLKSILKNILEEKNQKILIQPYVREIANGEISLIFINGKYQYALERHPKIFHERIATRNIEQVNREVIEFGKNTIEKLNYSNNLFTRVDLVIKNNKPKIMEVEVIEPYLYIKTLNDDKRNKIINELTKQIIERI